jgi:two-component system, OmpR family, response regulator ChvI
MTDSLVIAQGERTPVGSALSQLEPTAPPRARLVVVDDDALVRNTLERGLVEEGFDVRAFASGASALADLVGIMDVDIVLLDWKMPGMTGIEVLHAMRKSGLTMPVIFLTAMTDQTYEEDALRDGAVDFVEKGRSFSILLHRIDLILNGKKAAATTATGSSVVQFGELQLKRDVFDAFWKRQEVPLTLTEFKIIDLLVSQQGEHVPYRTLYDIVHGKDFVAGAGPDGYRANVRTFIKRIRKKFREIDDSWDLIENYAGFGYRWRVGEGNARQNWAHGAAVQEDSAPA